MRVSDYIQYDAYALAQIIKQRSIDPNVILDCALQRMQEVNPYINAIITDCSDWARLQLANMTGHEPYYGVPLLVKDLGFYIEGVRATSGSRALTNNLATGTSDFIKRLLDLGFLPFAKTNVPELGLSYVTESEIHGACRNPYALERTSGGSSGGSAAAVACGIAPVATANDGGGSIRVPAACCGLFGFKPTPDLTPCGPWLAELWSGMASNHVLTRSIRDSIDLFGLLTSDDKYPGLYNRLQETPESTYSIACVDGIFEDVPIDPSMMDAVLIFKEQLQSSGNNIQSMSLSLDIESIGTCALTLIAANTCAEIEYFARLLNSPVDELKLEPITWEFFKYGKKLSASQYVTAKHRLFLLVKPLHNLLEKVDMILSPALAQLPLKIGELASDLSFTTYLQKNVEFSPFTSLFNQAGLPAMTLPVGRYDHLPISIQLGSGKYKDEQLLKLALQMQPNLLTLNNVITPK